MSTGHFKSIEEQINDILAWLHQNKDSLDVVQCSEKLVNISVLKASLDSELADKEIAYNQVLNEIITTFPEKPFNKIQIQARATDEYKKLLKAKAVAGSVLEVARSLKRYQNAMKDSQELSTHY
jgi:hypothetical protein